MQRWRRFSSALSRRSEVLICLLVFATICADYVIVPLLNTVAPALACGLLALLIVKRQSRTRESDNRAVFELPSQWRITLFLVLNCALLVTARFWQNDLRQGSLGTPIILGIAKYLILLPAVVLMPLKSWITFLRRYRRECLAALIALATFYPYRTLHFVWPWYSQWLSQGVFWFSRVFISGLQLVPGASPVLSGPALDVVVIPDCGGLQSVKLFQILFASLLILDWDYLNKLRTLGAYWGGLLLMLMLNVARISLLVIVGNKWDPVFIVHHHVILSTIFPAAFLGMFLWIGYEWLVTNVEDTSSPLLHHQQQRLSIQG